KLGTAGMLDALKIVKKTEGEYTLNLGLQEDELRKSLIPLAGKLFSKRTATLRIKGKAHAKVWGILGKKFDINESKEISLKELIKNMKL
ncbi:MAG: hypothetical protein ABF258_07970, partial [Flavobacteriales bacterium]